jgi:ferric-dicitrate binding protein FerR (iron transport regulator)
MLTIEIDPGDVESKQAAAACQQLFLELKMSAPEAEIARSETPAIVGHRELVTILTTLVVTGVKLGVFAGMLEVLKTWLANRPKATIKVKLKDGSELELSGVSQEQAIEMFKQHAAEIA